MKLNTMNSYEVEYLKSYEVRQPPIVITGSIVEFSGNYGSTSENHSPLSFLNMDSGD